MEAMEPQELKSLVEAGTYKPDPEQIASAMLQRRGMRELLTGFESPIDAGKVSTALQSGQTPGPRAARPRAA
jgi:Anti-sigma-28 factor, FlgM